MSSTKERTSAFISSDTLVFSHKNSQTSADTRNCLSSHPSSALQSRNHWSNSAEGKEDACSHGIPSLSRTENVNKNEVDQKGNELGQYQGTFIATW